MKKTCYGLMILFILSLFILPIIMGYYFSQHYDSTLQQISKNLKITIKLMKYERGFFHSKALLAVNYPLADLPLPLKNINQNNALFIKQDIYHGPIAFDQENLLPKIHIGLAYIKSFLDQEIPLAHTTISFTHDSVTHLFLNTFSRRQEGKLVYFINGLKGTFFTRGGYTNLVADLKIKLLYADLTSPRVIKDFMTSQNLVLFHGAWLGETNYHFGTLEWQQAGKNFKFSDFNFGLDSKLHDQKIQLALMSNINSLYYDHANYGPQEMAISLSQLDMDNFKKVQSSLINSILDPSQQTSHLFQNNLIALARQGLALNINTLNLNTACGPIHVQGTLVCSPKQPLTHLFDLFLAANIHTHGQVPIAVATNLLSQFHLTQMDRPDTVLANKMAENSINSFEAKGYLRARGMELFWEK